MTSLVVLRKLPDGTHGLLNIIDTGDEHTRAVVAAKLQAGWQGHFPGDVITVKKAPGDKCREVNNHDGFPDRRFAEAAE